MWSCQGYNPIEVAAQDRTDANGERPNPAFDKCGEGRINVTAAANIQDNYLRPGRGRRKHIALLLRDSPIIRIAGKKCDRLRLRNELGQETEPLSSKVDAGVNHAGDVAARPAEAGDEPKFDWIAGKHENNRDRGCDTLRRDRGCGSARRNDHFSLAAKEIGNHGVHFRRLPIRPTPINLHILSLDIARRLQALSEPVREGLAGLPLGLARIHAEEADQRRRRALRARRWRPSCRRPTEPRNEVPPTHA
jgi:hypothetical protein